MQKYLLLFIIIFSTISFAFPVVDLDKEIIISSTSIFPIVNLDINQIYNGSEIIIVNLTDYVPYTGANNNVDLGEYNISANTITDGIISLNNGLFKDSSDEISINIESRYLADYESKISLSWGLRWLIDSMNKKSINWEDRQLINSDGNLVHFDWEKLSFPTLTTNGFLKTSGGDGSIIIDSNIYEESLGNPIIDDYILSSKADGTRIWVEMSGGDDDTLQSVTDRNATTTNNMTYPAWVSPENSTIRMYWDNGVMTIEG
jgi:hypothetical protein